MRSPSWRGRRVGRTPAASHTPYRLSRQRHPYEARLAEKLNDEEAALVSAALMHSLAQLKVKRRQHR